MTAFRACVAAIVLGRVAGFGGGRATPLCDSPEAAGSASRGVLAAECLPRASSESQRPTRGPEEPIGITSGVGEAQQAKLCAALDASVSSAGDSGPMSSAAPALVGELFDGPIDIVGDIHGEAGSLHALLLRLGYDGAGGHPEGRRLVFVGDLVDRGPDSLGVVRLVRSLVDRGRAQMILGNHELNLLRGDHKHGNHWFWGEVEHLCNGATEAKHPVLAPGSATFQVLLEDEQERASICAFLRQQPLVLQRDGLKVVHAMWHAESAEKLASFRGDAAKAFEEFEAIIQQKLDTELKDASKDERDMAKQNENPVTVLTTGMEVPAAEPFFAGGKMRTLERHRWWETYGGEAGLIVIGHYWRQLPDAEDLGFSPTGPPLFPKGEKPDLLGPSRAVMCVDYSVGLRYEERGRGLPEGSLGTALTALRLPEMRLHFADGRPAVELEVAQ